jgi:hypothetical protein
MGVSHLGNPKIPVECLTVDIVNDAAATNLFTCIADECGDGLAGDAMVCPFTAGFDPSMSFGFCEGLGSGGAGGAGGWSDVGGAPDATGGGPVGPPGNGGPPDGSGFDIQAFRTLFVGDTDPSGTASATAWEDYGFNIDGLHFVDVNQASFHCQLKPGGSPAAEILDGPNGLDNSFGKNVVPILQTFLATPSALATQGFQSGATGLVIQLADLGSGSDYTDLVAQVFDVRGSDAQGLGVGAPVAPTATQWMNGTYDASVTDPTMYQSLARFPMSYLSQDTWVSGAKADIPLTLFLGTGALSLRVHQGSFQLTYAADHASGTGGILSGVLQATELDAAIKDFAGSVSTSFCQPGLIQVILNQITGTSDINVDGTQHPDEACDGISIGLGFTTNGASLGVPAPAQTSSNPCP